MFVPTLNFELHFFCACTYIFSRLNNFVKINIFCEITTLLKWEPLTQWSQFGCFWIVPFPNGQNCHFWQNFSFFRKSLYSHCFLLHVEIVHRKNIITANQFLQQLNVDLVKVKHLQNIFFPINSSYKMKKKLVSKIWNPFTKKKPLNIRVFIEISVENITLNKDETSDCAILHQHCILPDGPFHRL